MNTFKKIYRALTRAERIIVLVSLGFAFVSSVFLAVHVAETKTVAVPARGGEYVEGMVGQPAYVNPVLAASEIDRSIARLVFETLGNLTSKIEPDPERRVWKVRLKENLRWSDNEKLTTDDIIFTIQKIQDPDAQSPLSPHWQGVAAVRESELELTFMLAAPYAFFEDNLKNLSVIPKHIFRDLPPSNWRLSNYNLSPVGNGPYVFVAYEQEPGGFISSYRLVANPFYALTPPYIEHIVIKFFGSNEDLVRAFNAGVVGGFLSLTPEELLQIERPYQAISLRLPSYYGVFWNQNRNLALKDDAVRKALSFAIDREKLIESVFAGHGVAVYGPVPPGIPHALSPQTVGGITEAATLLDEAGWDIDETDGIRKQTIKKSSVSLEFTLLVPNVPFLVKTADFLASSWRSLGANVHIVSVSADTLFETNIKNRDYEALLFGNVLGENADLFSFWHSSERFAPGLNLSLYNNQKVDGLIEEIRQNLEPDERSADFEEVQRLIMDDYPAAFLYSPEYLYVANKNLKGVVIDIVASASDRLKNAARWYLKTARIFK